MPIDPAERIANWDEKYSVERITAILAEKRPQMLARVRAVYVALVAMEQQVKEVLNLSGIPTMYYIFYLDYGREMWRLKNRDISGDSLAAESAVLIDKWAARGLVRAVLETISTQVFDVQVPTP